MSASSSAAERVTARRRRDTSARRYRPAEIDLLLVAEAPPSDLGRCFYFPDVSTQDSLFRHVVKSVLHAEPDRSNKPLLLDGLRQAGVFLVDLAQEPVDGSDLAELVPGLVRRVRRLRPNRIILIKTTVYDVAYRPMRDAGLPVLDARVPFPGSGQQRRFAEAFARAIAASPSASSGVVTLIGLLAHHEAGHVIADRLGGVAVSRVAISESRGGRTDVKGLDEVDLRQLNDEPLRHKVEPAVVALLAGPFAEEAYTGKYDADRAALDLNKAAGLGLTCLPSDTTWPAYDRVLTERARRLVADHWGAIRELAARLEQTGKMTATDLNQFFEAAREVEGE